MILLVVRYGIKIKKKNFNFPVLDLIDYSIDELIQVINNNDLLADCYMDNLYNNINNCLNLDITDEQTRELRNYYLRGGMYKASNEIANHSGKG